MHDFANKYPIHIRQTKPFDSGYKISGGYDDSEAELKSHVENVIVLLVLVGALGTGRSAAGSESGTRAAPCSDFKASSELLPN